MVCHSWAGLCCAVFSNMFVWLGCFAPGHTRCQADSGPACWRLIFSYFSWFMPWWVLAPTTFASSALCPEGWLGRANFRFGCGSATKIRPQQCMPLPLTESARSWLRGLHIVMTRRSGVGPAGRNVSCSGLPSHRSCYVAAIVPDRHLCSARPGPQFLGISHGRTQTSA